MSLLKVLTFCLLCVFITQGSFAQQVKDPEVSKLSPNPSQRFIGLSNLAYGNMQTKKYEIAHKYFKEALVEYRKIPTNKERFATNIDISKLNNDFGITCEKVGDDYAGRQWRTKAVDYYRDAIVPYMMANNEWAVLGITNKLAKISLTYVNNRYELAADKYKRFLSYGSIKKPEVIAQAYYDYAALWLQKGSADTAMMTMKSGFTRLKTPEGRVVLYRKISELYFQIYKDSKQDPAYLNEALDYFKEEIEKEKNNYLKCHLYLIKGSLEIKHGKSGAALKDYTAAINLFQSEQRYDEAALACYRVAQDLYNSEDYQKSGTYLNEARNNLAKAKNLKGDAVTTINTQIAKLDVQIKEKEQLLKLEGRAVTLDEQLEEQQQFYKNMLLAAAVLVCLIMIGFFINQQRINRLLAKQNNEINVQKEQISNQKDDIEKQKDEIESSYNNIKVLGEIGQKITASLDVESVIQTVHTGVRSLVDMDRFGVGILNKKNNRLEFIKFLENKEGSIEQRTGLVQTLGTKGSFADICMSQKKEILVNDLFTEYKNYQDEQISAQNNQSPQSLIYIPLIADNETMGLITVQSYDKFAYSENNMIMLKTLATYTSIALQNANAYQIIESKNKNITDSIRYGEAIQQAVLPSTDRLMHFCSDYFVMFKPKDLVSGDFYWLSQIDNTLLIAAIDCTGHGVPGAFMSMIGNTLLNEIVNQNKEKDPAVVLEKLHLGVRKALKQEKESGMANDDGMDVCLCAIENTPNEQKRVFFAGAKRSLLVVPAPYGEVHEIKGDKKSIGGMQKEQQRRFSKQTLALEKNDLLILASDGYADQNNPSKEKFGSTRMKHLLLNTEKTTMSSLKETFVGELAKFQQDAAQRDDITVIAIKL
ncbi:MAG: GAF domain-containing protein [Cytophagales bacterium]|nr:MAG: GAF domain-containing protein [Cytophagales bacterium]TAF60038.1 MAG: GAF domain-containing protein [Cytophagales bacterium]